MSRPTGQGRGHRPSGATGRTRRCSPSAKPCGWRSQAASAASGTWGSTSAATIFTLGIAKCGTINEREKAMNQNGGAGTTPEQEAALEAAAWKVIDVKQADFRRRPAEGPSTGDPDFF